VPSGEDGNIAKLIFLKLLQNNETEGKFFNSKCKEFHASGAVVRGNLRRWSVPPKGITLAIYGFFSTQKLYTSSILCYIYAILFCGLLITPVGI
jgi:hypothetical protein